MANPNEKKQHVEHYRDCRLIITQQFDSAGQNPKTTSYIYENGTDYELYYEWMREGLNSMDEAVAHLKRVVDDIHSKMAAFKQGVGVLQEEYQHFFKSEIDSQTGKPVTVEDYFTLSKGKSINHYTISFNLDPPHDLEDKLRALFLKSFD